MMLGQPQPRRAGVCPALQRLQAHRTLPKRYPIAGKACENGIVGLVRSGVVQYLKAKEAVDIYVADRECQLLDISREGADVKSKKVTAAEETATGPEPRWDGQRAAWVADHPTEGLLIHDEASGQWRRA